jgi:hypothetical protein
VDQFDRRELERLVQRPSGRTVSIFLPTHRAGPQTQQDPIRLKNLLRDATSVLTEQGMADAEVKAFLRPAEALLAEQGFWQHQRDGLALFLREGEMATYRVPLRLPELVIVGERAYLKPLLPLLTGDGGFFMLALSQQDIRLLEGSRHSVDEVELEDVPKSLKEALKYDDAEKQLQFRSGPTGRPGGKQAAVFHGHDPKESAKDDILRYFRAVAEGIHEILRERREPLVLAGVDYLQPIYREANRYPQLLDEGIDGNPELLRPEELHAKAWEIVQPVFKEVEEAAREKYQELQGTGQAASDLAAVLQAAHHGRIDTLFVALGERRWGRYDEERGSVELAGDTKKPGDQDLLDLAAVQTLLTGGTVHAVAPERVPGGELTAAVLRY